MKPITADPALVAYCGLYCGACGKYRKGRCPGCHDNTKASWCGVRACNIERHYASCAECVDYPEVMDCKKFNNFFAKVFGLIFRSNRAACISQIKTRGIQGHAEEMVRLGRQSFKR